MKLKNKQILEAQQALGKLLNTNLPVKQAYHIKKTLESIKKQIMFIDEQRKDLIKKYGVEKEDGYFEIPVDEKEKREKFFTEYESLLEIEEEIDARKLTLDDLERVELTANEIETIEFMIEVSE